jgi:hypothetical protein
LNAGFFVGVGSELTDVDAELFDGLDSTQFLRSDVADVKTSGSLIFGDTIILAFGSDEDAEFYYDGIDLKLDLNTGIGSFSITDGIDAKFTFEKDGTLNNAGFFVGVGSELTDVDAELFDGLDSTQFLRSDVADVKTAGTLRFNDNVILSFGAGNDAEFFSNGSDFYLDLNNAIGTFQIRDSNTTKFTFDDNGDLTVAGNVTTNSDIRLKTNIKTISNPLEKVIKLRGVEYDRLDMENEHQIGVIAQEVEEVVPELVRDKNGNKTVSYGNITALLIEAIKEQQLQINALTEKIKILEGK